MVDELTLRTFHGLQMENALVLLDKVTQQGFHLADKGAIHLIEFEQIVVVVDNRYNIPLNPQCFSQQSVALGLFAQQSTWDGDGVATGLGAHH
jgi:hypothetical protein